MVGAVKPRILRVQSGPGKQQAPRTRILRGFAVEIRPKPRFGCMLRPFSQPNRGFERIFVLKARHYSTFGVLGGGADGRGWGPVGGI